MMSGKTVQGPSALRTRAQAEVTEIEQVAAEEAQPRQQLEWRHWRQSGKHGQTMEFQEKLCRLTKFDEGFVEGEAGLALGPVSASVLDAKTAALLQVGALVAIGSAAAALKWGVRRALAAGATENEITDVLLAVAPVTGLGRVVSAARQVATALGYHITPVMADLNDY